MTGEGERERIREALEFATEEDLRPMLGARRISTTALIGDAVIAAFFTGDKPGARDEAAADVRWRSRAASAAGTRRCGRSSPSLRTASTRSCRSTGRSSSLRSSTATTRGFDAIVGNPPFAGKNTIIDGNATAI